MPDVSTGGSGGEDRVALEPGGPGTAQAEGPGSQQVTPPPGTSRILAKGVPRPKVTLRTTIDPCAVADASQLRPIVQGMLLTLRPLAAQQGPLSLRLLNLILHEELSCPDLTATVRGGLMVRVQKGPITLTRPGSVRFHSPGELTVDYRAPLGSRQPESPSDVWSARLCLTDIDVVDLTVHDAPGWLDSTVVEACLSGPLPNWSGCRDLASEMCRNVTTLVQTYVGGGGEL